MLSSPIAPWKGAPLRVVFAAEKPLEGELALIAPDGKVAATSRDRTGGPPYFWFAEVAAPEAGTWQAKLAREGDRAGMQRRLARNRRARARSRRGRVQGKSVWPINNAWNRGERKLVFGMDREALRRAARRSPVVEGDA